MNRLMTLTMTALGIMTLCCMIGCDTDNKQVSLEEIAPSPSVRSVKARTPEEVVEEYFQTIQNQALDEAYVQEIFCSEFLVDFERAPQTSRKAFISSENARGRIVDWVKVIHVEPKEDGEIVKIKIQIKTFGHPAETTNFKVVQERGQWKILAIFRDPR